MHFLLCKNSRNTKSDKSIVIQSVTFGLAYARECVHGVVITAAMYMCNFQCLSTSIVVAVECNFAFNFRMKFHFYHRCGRYWLGYVSCRNRTTTTAPIDVQLQHSAHAYVRRVLAVSLFGWRRPKCTGSHRNASALAHGRLTCACSTPCVIIAGKLPQSMLASPSVSASSTFSPYECNKINNKTVLEQYMVGLGRQMDCVAFTFKSTRTCKHKRCHRLNLKICQQRTALENGAANRLTVNHNSNRLS